MARLTWQFRSPSTSASSGATSRARHGSYSVTWKGSATWVAAFERTGAGPGDRRLVGALDFFATLGGALRACQAHAD